MGLRALPLVVSWTHFAEAIFALAWLTSAFQAWVSSWAQTTNASTAPRHASDTRPVARSPTLTQRRRG